MKGSRLEFWLRLMSSFPLDRVEGNRGSLEGGRRRYGNLERGRQHRPRCVGGRGWETHESGGSVSAADSPRIHFSKDHSSGFDKANGGVDGEKFSGGPGRRA
jgi:hypothetical protein